MSINGININNPNYSAARNFSPLTEEELELRKLTREVHSRLDFNGIKANVLEGRRRFTEQHVAQNGATPRPAMTIPFTTEQNNQMLSVLEELRTTTEDGSIRMTLIDRMMADIRANLDSQNGQFA